MSISRRSFFQGAAGVAAGFAALRNITGCDRASDIKKGGKQGSGAILEVPPNFDVRVISKHGELMDDGLITPGAHDGMCAFADGGKTVLVCNHELDAGSRDRGPLGKDGKLISKIDKSCLYDSGYGERACLGGTTTLVYDTAKRKVERQFASLLGTVRNCAGGPTPWGSWITCEESTVTVDAVYERDHGYNFEVPAKADSGLVEAVPLTAMGRFNHEAVAVHPRTGIVYQTEDRPDGLIYRFVPKKPGELLKGGRLQALRVRDAGALDTRNWRAQTVSVGQTMAVDWVDLEDVESPEDDLRLQGFYGLKAARFARGEGMWYGRGSVYFACTNGGRFKKGQIWKYTPGKNEGRPEESASPGRLQLWVEGDDSGVIDSADNLTMAPWGDVFVCEDRADARLLRVTPDGKVHLFARNVASSSELAGVTFSPDGTTLFVNLQNPGMTVAVTGPWKALEGAGVA